MDAIYCLRYVEAAVPPLVFLLSLWFLLESKYSSCVTQWAALGFLAVECGVQLALFSWERSLELTATLLPISLYLPAILCLHLLSKNHFFSTALVWMLALLCSQLLAALRKLLIHFAIGPAMEWLCALSLLAAAGFILLLVHRFLCKPFRAYAREQTGGWAPLLFLPTMLLILHSYFLSSTTDPTVTLLLLFTALSAFLVLSRLIASLAAERRSREARQQMEALRRDYELLRKKLELGRSYRHDMRHHINVLSTLLQQGDAENAQHYVNQWQSQLAGAEAETWCRNAAVNAVLSVYLTRARESGCTLDTKIFLPGEMPFEEMDLCVVLANALENAIYACEKLPEGAPRQLRISASLASGRSLAVSVENSCSEHLEFDGNGFPIVPYREGHGQGLRSIAAVAEKYHGMFQCVCEDGVFTLRVVLLDTASQPQTPSRTGEVLLAGLLFCFLINATPTLAQALESIPVLGSVVRVVDLRTYTWNWGGTGETVQTPVLEGDPGAVDALDAEMEELIQEMKEQFRWYAARKYQGYAAEDISYEVIRDDSALFTLCFHAVINMGGSVDYSRYLTLDKETGKVLELPDLFQLEANYVFPISREIRAQMEEQNNAGKAAFFLPGGIWSDEECFKSIAIDQNFYINDENQLVIVFDEYEVAPGSMGTPEFVIPTELLNGLLAQPSVLR